MAGRDYEDTQRDINEWNESNMQAAPAMGGMGAGGLFGGQQQGNGQQGGQANDNSDEEQPAQSPVKENWDENKHPRDNIGQFASKDGSGGSGTLQGNSRRDVERKKDADRNKAYVIDEVKRNIELHAKSSQSRRLALKKNLEDILPRLEALDNDIAWSGLTNYKTAVAVLSKEIELPEPDNATDPLTYFMGKVNQTEPDKEKPVVVIQANNSPATPPAAETNAATQVADRLKASGLKPRMKTLSNGNIQLSMYSLPAQGKQQLVELEIDSATGKVKWASKYAYLLPDSVGDDIRLA